MIFTFEISGHPFEIHASSHTGAVLGLMNCLELEHLDSISVGKQFQGDIQIATFTGVTLHNGAYISYKAVTFEIVEAPHAECCTCPDCCYPSDPWYHPNIEEQWEYTESLY